MTTQVIRGRAPSASAADASTLLRITFNRLTCIRETSELGADDPYLVFIVANLSAFPYPTVVSLSDTFTMGEGETRRQGQGEDGNRRHLGPLWPIDGSAGAPIRASDDVLVLVALVESDGGPGLALSVQNAVQASLAINVPSIAAPVCRLGRWFGGFSTTCAGRSRSARRRASRSTKTRPRASASSG